MQKYKVYAQVAFNLEYEVVAENEDKAFEIGDKFLQEKVERDFIKLSGDDVKIDYEVFLCEFYG